MKAEGCRPWRELIGVYVLGQLDEDRALGLRAHLDGCAACRTEASELAAVAALLAAAKPFNEIVRATVPPHLGDDVIARVRSEQRLRRRGRTRRRAATTLIAAATLLLGMVVGGALVREPAESFPTAHVTLTGTTEGVDGEATLEYLPWGTRIELEAAGLEDGVTYEVYMERVTGGPVEAGTFTAIGRREMHVTLAAALGRADCKAIKVSGPDGMVLWANMPWATPEGAGSPYRRF